MQNTPDLGPSDKVRLHRYIRLQGQLSGNTEASDNPLCKISACMIGGSLQPSTGRRLGSAETWSGA
eukprot:1145017-Pelagomonas_calceolata.AAC.4